MSKRLRVTLGVVLALVIPTFYVVLFQPTLIFNNVESTIAAQLQESIGPAASYTVKIRTPLHRLVRGDMGDIAIMGRQVRLQNGMVAERLFISLSEVKADVMSGTIASISDDAFSVTINQADMDRYIAARFPEMPDLTVEMQDGKLAVSTREKVMFIKSRVNFDGTMEIEEGKKLMLRLHDLNVGKVKIPGAIRGRIEGKLNPILDTSSWSMGTEFSDVVISKGKIEVFGKVDPRDLTALQKASAQ